VRPDLASRLATVALAVRRAAEQESRERRRAERPAVELPTWATIAAAAVLVVTVVMALAGAVRTGINVDEPVHLLRLDTWFDTGWYLPWFYMDGDQPASTVTDTYVYAPVAMLAAHLITVMVGVEGWGHLESTAQAYAVRHVVIAGFGLVGLAAVAATARLMLASWRWGLVAAAVLGAIPLWTGHAMFNVKDTPVATGVAVAALGLVALSRPRIGTSRRLRWLATATLGAGTFLALGVRPGSWPMIALGASVMVLSTWATVRSRTDPATARITTVVRLGLVGTGLGGAWLSLAVLYPNAFSNLPRLLRSSLGESTDFVAWDGWVLTNGFGHGVPSPWWYVPVWVVNQIPVVILVAAIIGLAVVPARLLSRRDRRDAGRPSRSACTFSSATERPMIGLGVVIAATLSGPLASLVLDVRLHSGLRQLLFMLPGIALLATVGLWAATLGTGRRVGRRRVVAARRPVRAGDADGRPAATVPVQLRLLQRGRDAERDRRTVGHRFAADEFPRDHRTRGVRRGGDLFGAPERSGGGHRRTDRHRTPAIVLVV
jgi:hypothetical protein